MWALDGLAWVFDWGAGRFWDLASAFRGFWLWDWQPLAWAGDIAEGLAIFCWTARDRIRDFDAWIEHQLWYWGWQLQILRERLDYWIGTGFARLQELWDAFTGWLRQKAEDAWNKANELWNVVWSTIKPTLDWLSSQFGAFKSWVENTAVPWLQTQVTNLGTRLDQLRAEASTWWDSLQAVKADIDSYRDLWNSLQAVKDRVVFTFTDGWDTLKMFLKDPAGTIWAELEKTLLDRVEQFLNERWDTPR